MVQVLLDLKADVNASDDYGWTPTHGSSAGSPFASTYLNIHHLWPDVAQLLLEHGAEVNSRTNDSQIPLYVAKMVEFVHVLLAHGANRGAVDRTTLHTAAEHRVVKIIHVLLELGANVNAVWALVPKILSQTSMHFNPACSIFFFNLHLLYNAQDERSMPSM
jgi:ankyrin repeat protein